MYVIGSKCRPETNLHRGTANQTAVRQLKDCFKCECRPLNARIVEMQSLRKLPSSAGIGFALVGLALGATAIGALAIGALAVGKLGVRRGRIEKLTIGELTVDKLIVREQISGGQD